MWCEMRLAHDDASAGVGHCRESVQAEECQCQPVDTRTNFAANSIGVPGDGRAPSTVTGTKRLLTNPR